ncbi:phenylacetate--CoA ligase family protein [Flavobacterium algicola]|uniref:phenylacetate--CoA ligase family protein n=1 Tax=Flavobacterium algicola TaxID=556529 RepID=UPI001EFDA007|nr:phenylacetate--CoA ligase family protein [Flavobacterium algicola]MCG9791804.1 phenylacetate--CoA ligase family protein [Flavobacterium algicola]
MFSLFKLSLQLSGFPIRKAKTALQKIISLPESERLVFIESQKKAIVKYHLDNNLFYSELVGSSEFEDWDTLPILTKGKLQQPLTNRLSKGYTVKNSYINKTSGSSGNPFVFAKDKYSHALTWASNYMRFGWHNIDLDTAYQARFYGIPKDFRGRITERFKDLLSNRYRFSVFDLSDKKLESFLKKFENSRFHYINGYTSAIVLFAKFLERKNIVLKNVCPTLKVCVVTSEMLFEKDRMLLERQFGIAVVNEYGASELDLIAFENAEGQWQINTETLYVEIVDEKGTALPYGETGRVVVTSLFNEAHSFIRYEIGDIGTIDENSTPEKPILKQLIGRTNDIVQFPTGKKSGGLVFYYVTKSIIEDSGNVKEFIIKQIELDYFIVDYVSERELNGIEIEKIEKAIQLYLEPNLKFDFIRKDILQRTARGKLRQFTSELGFS